MFSVLFFFLIFSFYITAFITITFGKKYIAGRSHTVSPMFVSEHQKVEGLVDIFFSSLFLNIYSDFQSRSIMNSLWSAIQDDVLFTSFAISSIVRLIFN